MPTANPRPPLVLLTGFLGAGKTTTLNRVLGRQQRLRVGVIINELGRIDIDTRLDQEPRRRRDGAGGRLRLSRGARPVRAVGRDRRGQRAVRVPDVVLLETTGIAEPWSILSRAGGSRRRGAGRRRRRRVRRRRRGGRRPARPSRGGARAGGGRRSDPADQAGSRARRGGRGAAPGAGAAQPGRRARQLPRRRRGRPPRWSRGCSTCAARRARRAPSTRTRTRTASSSVVDVHRSGAAARPSRCSPSSTAWARRWCARRASFTWRATPARLPRARGRAHRPRDSASPGAAEPPRTELVLIGDGLDADAIRRQIWACRSAARLVQREAGGDGGGG